MPERKATTKYEVQGADQAAQAEKKIADAQRDTAAAAKEKADALSKGGGQSLAQAGAGLNAQASAMGKAAAVAKKLGEETKKLDASTADYATTLALLNPTMGSFAGAAQGALKVANDLAKANLLSGENAAKATEHIKKNAGAYKLLGAAGLALFAINRVKKAWQDMQEEIAEATELVKEFQRVQSGIGAERESVRDQVKEQLFAKGEATPEAVEQATKRAQQLKITGFDAQTAAQAAAAGQGAGFDLDQSKLFAAAIKSGVIDPSSDRAARRFGGLGGRDRDTAEDALDTIESERSRVFSKGLNQFDSRDVFKTTKGPFSKREVVDQGDDTLGLEAFAAVTGRKGEGLKKLFDLGQKVDVVDQGEASFKQVGVDPEQQAAMIAEARAAIQQIRAMVAKQDRTGPPPNVTITGPIYMGAGTGVETNGRSLRDRVGAE